MHDTDGLARDHRQATDRWLTAPVAGDQAGPLIAAASSSAATHAGQDEVRCERVFVATSGNQGLALEERAAVLALAEAAGQDAHRATAAIEANGSALGLLSGDRRWLEQWEAELVDDLAGRVGPADLERARAVVLEQLERGVEVVTVLDAAYPINLRRPHDLPAALYVRGSLPATRRVVAIVGSRRPSAEGRRRTVELAQAVAAEGMVVVSELARGVAAIALRSAITAGGSVLAAHGAGIDVPNSAERERVAENVVRKGALVTASPPGTCPSRRTLRTRAALVSGLASTVVVVEGICGAAVAQSAFAHGRWVLFAGGLSAEEAWAQRCLSCGLGATFTSPTELVERVRRLTEPIEAGIVN